MIDVKIGQRVFFKHEWNDAGDEHIVFRAVEVFDDDDDDVIVEAELGLPINPRQSVANFMIEKAE